MWFKRKQFIVRPLLDRAEIKECLIDIDYNLDLVEDTAKGINVERLRERYNDLQKELKSYIKI